MKVEIAQDENGPYFLLTSESAKQPIVVRADFEPRTDIGLRSDLLARALGYKKGMAIKILDATAGLCRDSFHMASLGCEVVALEQNEKLFQVVSYYVNRLSDGLKLQIEQAEARQYLRALVERPDVIYLDPMFPEKKKAALPCKEAQLLKALVSTARPEEEQELLELALSATLRRVVVKRPLTAPPIGAPLPQIQFSGKTVRYDVYLRNLVFS